MQQSLDANDIAAAQAALEEERDESQSKVAEELLATITVNGLKNGAVMSGQLLKRSAWKHEWKLRHVVIKDGLLYSCKDAKTTPNNVVILNSTTQVVHSCSTVGDEKTKRILSERTRAFAVSDHTGQCFFLAPNASESADGSDWIKLLEGIVKDDMLAARYKSVLLPKLQSGSTFTKKNFSTLGAMSTRDQNRVVSVSMDCRSIMWHKPELAEFDAIQFKDITNVVAGAETQVFKRQRKAVSSTVFADDAMYFPFLGPIRAPLRHRSTSRAAFPS